MTVTDTAAGCTKTASPPPKNDEVLHTEGFRVSRGGATDDETAAALAVLTQALREVAEQPAGARVGPDAWARSQRPLRHPLQPGHGSWRSFSA